MARSLWLQGLRLKVVLLLVASLSIVGGSLCLFFLERSKSDLLSQVEKRGLTVADNLAYLARVPLSVGDMVSITKYSQSMSNQKDVVYVLILGKKGEVLASYDPEGKGVKHRTAILEKVFSSTKASRHDLPESSLWGFAVPIISQGQGSSLGDDLLLGMDAPKPAADAKAGGTLGYVDMGISLEDTNAQVNRNAVVGVAITVLLILLGIVASALIANPTVTYIRSMADFASSVSSGDLTRSIQERQKDEVGFLAKALNKITNELNPLVGRIRDVAEKLSAESSSIVEVSQQQESGSAQQAAAVNETTATMEELGQTSKQIADNAQQVAKIAEETLSVAMEGQGAVHQVEDGMRAIQGNSKAMAESIMRFSKKVQQIGHIVEIIDEIADKSDLLALNAALEGAKAGEVGKGFSLVAAEMRRLAESVVGSTKEIRKLIEEIQEATQGVVMTTEVGIKAAEQGTVISGSATQSFQRIVNRVKETTEAARQISLATQQQKSGTEQVVASMVEMVEVSRQGAAGSKEVTKSAMDLTALAADLRNLIGKFRVDGSHGH